jgi:hypothetical protein
MQVKVQLKWITFLIVTSVGGLMLFSAAIAGPASHPNGIESSTTPNMRPPGGPPPGNPPTNGGGSPYPPRTGGYHSGGIFNGWYGYYANNSKGYYNNPNLPGIVAAADHTNITEIWATLPEKLRNPNDRSRAFWEKHINRAERLIRWRLEWAKQANVKAIVDVSGIVFYATQKYEKGTIWRHHRWHGICYHSNPFARADFEDLVESLINKNDLVPGDPKDSVVVAFYIADEPAINCLADENSYGPNSHLVSAVRAIRKNPNTMNFPLVAIVMQDHYDDVDIGLHLLDWVGLDDYHSHALGYLAHFSSFEQSMINGEDIAGGDPQHFFLVPLVSTGKGEVHPYYWHTTAILNKYRSDDKVIGIMPFRWDRNGNGIYGKWWLDEYIDIGKYIAKDGPLPEPGNNPPPNGSCPNSATVVPNRYCCSCNQ